MGSAWRLDLYLLLAAPLLQRPDLRGIVAALLTHLLPERKVVHGHLELQLHC